MCTQKTRWLEQDSKHVVLAFKVFQRFYALNYQGRKDKTFDEFVNSQFYVAFTRFGRYLLHMQAINPMGFVDFLIKTQVKLEKWESPLVYETYVRELNKKETPDAAVERCILLMLQWSEQTGEPWHDFFRKINPNQATLWIKSGRISPWIVYAASSAQEMFDRLSDEQLSIVQQNLDPGFWNARINRAKEDVQWIKDQLDAVGV